MKRALPFITAAIFLSCSEQTKQKPQVGDRVEVKTLFLDSAGSTIKVHEMGYTIVNTSYEMLSTKKDGERKTYIARVTRLSDFMSGSMGPERKVKIELSTYDNPKQVVRVIEKKADLVEFREEYIETTTIGCCGGENVIEFTDYDNQLIVKGTPSIVKGEIPRPEIKFFVGVEGNTVVYSYSASDKYEVEIKFDTLSPTLCLSIPLEVGFDKLNEDDHYYPTSDTYSFQSLSEIKSKNEINGISLFAHLPCTDSTNTVIIPIINGKPFGKDSRHQTALMKVKY
jgi:hypothetical protein